MIQSGREYAIATTELAKLKEAYAPFTPIETTWLNDVQRRAMESIIADLEAEIAEYRDRNNEQ